MQLCLLTDAGGPEVSRSNPINAAKNLHFWRGICLVAIRPETSPWTVGDPQAGRRSPKTVCSTAARHFPLTFPGFVHQGSVGVPNATKRSLQRGKGRSAT